MSFLIAVKDDKKQKTTGIIGKRGMQT